MLLRNVPVRRVALADGEAHVATVFDLLCANYGLDRGLGGACAKGYRRQRALHARLAGADHGRRPPTRRSRSRAALPRTRRRPRGARW